MPDNNRHFILLCSLILGLIHFTSPCAIAEPSSLPASLLAENPPGSALSVVEAKRTAKAGESIVIRGRVGGTMKPLSEKAAIAILADTETVKACSDIPDDECETPWDYCCETPEALRKSTATIQVAGEDGKVLRSGLRGLGGLKELSTLIVEGMVDKASNGDLLIVNVRRIHVEK